MAEILIFYFALFISFLCIISVVAVLLNHVAFVIRYWLATPREQRRDFARPCWLTPKLCAPVHKNLLETRYPDARATGLSNGRWLLTNRATGKTMFEVKYKK